MGLTKVAVIGAAGKVGACSAFTMILRNLSVEVIVVDADIEQAQTRLFGEWMDLEDATFRSCTRICKGNFKDASQADIIVITAGAAQRPGEPREQLVGRNFKIIQSIYKNMKPINPNAIVLVVSNPVDILTEYFSDLAVADGFRREQIFGSGTFLDTNRLRTELARELQVNHSSLHCYVVGMHGDSQFVAWHAASVGGIPMLKYPGMEKLDRKKHSEKIKNKAYEIIECKGATYFGVAVCVARIVEFIIKDSHSVIPLSVYVPANGCYISNPAVLSRNGIHRIIDLNLDEEETQYLHSAVSTLKSLKAAGLKELEGMN
ncbi:uncharacterized protein VTP21DRAFT_7669 [Calcarisporiella thermophila]|uniref:uncharacterized protein n=1 Tax=Calcarisporiella thermophila TaxID=911321 RepID=UPI003742FBE4